MGSFSTTLPCDIPRLLSRSEADQARRRFYNLTGLARDDAMLPKLVPPGSVIVQELADANDTVGRPARDVAVPLSEFKGPLGVITSSGYAGSVIVSWPTSGTLINGNWVGPMYWGYTRVLGPYQPRDTKAVYTDNWWYDTPWGRERAILWVSPMLPAPGGWWPSKIVPLEERDVVLVEHPHHFVQGADVEATKTGMDVLDVSDAYPRRVTVAQVPARHVLVPDTSLSRGQTGIVRTADGWAGYFSYESRGSGFSLGDLVDNFVDTVERAGQAIGRMDLKTLESVAVTALAVAVAGPAGLALMGSEKPWRDASLLAAGTYFFGYSPLMRLAEAPAGYTVTGGLLEMGTGSPIQVGMTELAGTSMISLPNGLLVTAEDIGAAEAIFQKLSLLAPEQAQALLEKIASEGAYIDLIFTRLVVEAEKNEERRERLLAEFSAKQAVFWENYGRWIAAALGAIVTVLTLGTAAEGAAFLYGLLETLYTAGVTVQNLEVQARAAREQERAMERELAEIDAEIARLEAEEEAALRAEEDARLAPAGASAEPQRAGVPWWLGLLFLLGGK